MSRDQSFNADFDKEIMREMGSLGILGATIQGTARLSAIFHCHLSVGRGRLSRKSCSSCHPPHTSPPPPIYTPTLPSCLSHLCTYHTPLTTLLTFHTPHLPHSSPSTLLTFHTPHLPHSSPSTLLIFHTPHLPHSSPSTLLTFHTPHLPHLSLHFTSVAFSFGGI